MLTQEIEPIFHLYTPPLPFPERVRGAMVCPHYFPHIFTHLSPFFLIFSQCICSLFPISPSMFSFPHFHLVNSLFLIFPQFVLFSPFSSSMFSFPPFHLVFFLFLIFTQLILFSSCSPIMFSFPRFTLVCSLFPIFPQNVLFSPFPPSIFSFALFLSYQKEMCSKGNWLEK